MYVMTRSQAAVVKADDETMQLSNAHGSVVCANDASTSPRRMVHTNAHTRESLGREGAGRVKRERVKSRTRREGARRREREGVKPRGERGYEAKRESAVRTEQER